MCLRHTEIKGYLLTYLLIADAFSRIKVKTLNNKNSKNAWKERGKNNERQNVFASTTDDDICESASLCYRSDSKFRRQLTTLWSTAFYYDRKQFFISQATASVPVKINGKVKKTTYWLLSRMDPAIYHYTMWEQFKQKNISFSSFFKR